MAPYVSGLHLVWTLSSFWPRDALSFLKQLPLGSRSPRQGSLSASLVSLSCRLCYFPSGQTLSDMIAQGSFPSLLLLVPTDAIWFTLGWVIQCQLHADDEPHVRITVLDFPSELIFRPPNPIAYSTSLLRNLTGLSSVDLSLKDLLNFPPSQLPS